MPVVWISGCPKVCSTIWIMLKKVPSFCLLLCILPALLQGLEILDPEEVEYIHLRTQAAVNSSATLHCGSIMPTIFIWGYTKPGSESNLAVAYNYGQGPKLQPLASSLGQLSLVPNTSTLVIHALPLSAEGLYTCQALYDTDEGAKITFYFTQLDVQDEDD